jgi:hypothetical protein
VIWFVRAAHSALSVLHSRFLLESLSLGIWALTHSQQQVAVHAWLTGHRAACPGAIWRRYAHIDISITNLAMSGKIRPYGRQDASDKTMNDCSEQQDLIRCLVCLATGASALPAVSHALAVLGEAQKRGLHR